MPSKTGEQGGIILVQGANALTEPCQRLQLHEGAAFRGEFRILDRFAPPGEGGTRHCVSLEFATTLTQQADQGGLLSANRCQNGGGAGVRGQPEVIQPAQPQEFAYVCPMLVL